MTAPLDYKQGEQLFVFDAKVIKALVGAIQMANSTLSEASPLVSLIQGDNSFGSLMGAIQTIND